jgi:hypothetical protein
MRPDLHHFDAFASNPGHWKLGIFYFCPADPRIFIPRRRLSLGWTLNFARPLAVPFLALVMAGTYVISDLLAGRGLVGDTLFVGFLFAVAVLCGRLARFPVVKTGHPDLRNEPSSTSRP